MLFPGFLLGNVLQNWAFVSICFVNPTKIPSLKITPLSFNLVTGSPHETGVEVPVDGIERAIGYSLDLCVVEVVRVVPAHALVNADVSKVPSTVWTNPFFCPVKVSIRWWVLDVCLWA